ncbi:MAG: hypothetical protein AAB448_02570 [Patescibacteria group bacterium]
MFFSCFRRGVISFFVAFTFFLPSACFAFDVLPSVSDVSFSAEMGEVTQLISVFNRGVDQKMYDAEIQLIIFAPDGSIAGFSDVPSVIGASVSPKIAEVPADTEQVFTVVFSHAEQVTPDQVFGLVIHERELEYQQLSSAFVAFIFPEGVASAGFEASFRIDAFSVTLTEGVLQGVVQFTNTGTVVAKPTSIILAQDMFGRELARSVFAEQTGRLPVGTTRVIVDVLPYDHFGFWHVGGPVSFSLLSVVDEGGVVQWASVELFTTPGKGVIAVMACSALFFAGGAIFLLKRRGILQA